MSDTDRDDTLAMLRDMLKVEGQRAAQIAAKRMVPAPAYGECAMVPQPDRRVTLLRNLIAEVKRK